MEKDRAGNHPHAAGRTKHLYPNPPRPEFREIEVRGGRLHVALMTGSGQTPLLMILGSPGDWQAWARYLDTPGLEGFSPRIAVDRPGFGGSGPGKVITDLRAQAQRRPLILIQGERDALVDPRTANYAEQRLPPRWREIRRLPDQGHFVLWKQPATVIAAIRSLSSSRSPSSRSAADAAQLHPGFLGKASAVSCAGFMADTTI